MLTTTEAYDDAALTSLLAAATLLGADLHVGIVTNDLTPSKDLTLADMTEPVYASYARQVVVMGVPYRDPVNGITAAAAQLVWQQSGTPTPCIIRGIFYATGATPYLVAFEKLNPPIPLNDTLDAFHTVLQYIQSNENPGLTTVIR